jgi:hypothetical protein
MPASSEAAAILARAIGEISKTLELSATPGAPETR